MRDTLRRRSRIRLSTHFNLQLSTPLQIPPAIARELRIESRRPLNFWLRALGAGAILAVAVIWHGDAFQSASELGPELFGNLNAALYIGIVLGAPLLTADCLSRERREGTLHLLFLTPLTPAGIVAAKSFVHALRALTVTAAALPIVCLSVLFGGAGWKEGLLASMHNGAALLLALGAGLVASTHTTQARWAGAAAVALSVLFTLLGFAVHTLCVCALYGRLLFGNHAFDPEFLWRTFVAEPLAGTGADGYWTKLTAPMNSAHLWSWMLATLLFVLLVATAFAVIVRHAANRLRDDSRTGDWHPVVADWIAMFGSPFILRDALRESIGRQLGRNPIGWLHLRSTSARLTKWLWALAVAGGGFYMYSARVGGTDVLAIALGGGMAFAAAGSFQRERETGVMELLLVAPLSVGQIMWGRIRGLWAQFLPAVVALAAVKTTYALRYYRFDFSILVYTLTAFLALAPIGLRYSLQAKNVVVAWIQTVATALLAPAAFAGLISLFLGPVARSAGGPVLRYLPAFVFVVALIVVGAVATSRLHRNLRRRDFVIQ